MPDEGLRATGGEPGPDARALIEKKLRLLMTLRRAGIGDTRVLGAIEKTPREKFVPAAFEDRAYENVALPIGQGQSVSQPYVVALMTEKLEVGQRHNVLEIGTGSGYQTAVLAELAKEVFTVERHATLATRAEAVLRRLSYSNVHVVIADGSRGYPEAAPYDAIVVTAAAPRVPPALFEQLAEGGRLIIPVGTHLIAISRTEGQTLQAVRKLQGQPVTQVLDGVRFVPLIGSCGFEG